MRRLHFLLLLIAIFSTACSRMEVAVRWADTVALAAAKESFDLDREQKKQFQVEFKKALHEVQRNEFVRMADWLDQAQKNLELPPDQSQIAKQIETGGQILLAAAARFEDLAQQLINQQVDKGFARFDKHTEKRLQEDDEKLQDAKKLRKQFAKMVDFWIDETVEDLTVEQQKVLDKLAETLPQLNELRLASRKKVFARFQQERQDPKTRTSFVRKFILDWQSLQSPEYLAARKQQQQRISESIYEIQKTLTSEQKAHLIKNLQKRSKEFRELSTRFF